MDGRSQNALAFWTHAVRPEGVRQICREQIWTHEARPEGEAHGRAESIGQRRSESIPP